MMRTYVNSQKFSSTTEVVAAMKEMFKEVLQQVMEGELDEELGYEKSKRMSESSDVFYKIKVWQGGADVFLDLKRPILDSFCNLKDSLLQVIA